MGAPQAWQNHQLHWWFIIYEAWTPLRVCVSRCLTLAWHPYNMSEKSDECQKNQTSLEKMFFFVWHFLKRSLHSSVLHSLQSSVEPILVNHAVSPLFKWNVACLNPRQCNRMYTYRLTYRNKFLFIFVDNIFDWFIYLL